MHKAPLRIVATVGQSAVPRCDGDLGKLLARVRACDLCREDLPLGPRPVLRVDSRARLLLIGQAPGTKVHETGIPWNDASGDRLRGWLGLSREQFYDSARVAIVPMGLCYPGRLPRGGDRPPRAECAPLWHPPLLAALPNLEFTLLIGRYAQARYLDNSGSVAGSVAAWREVPPEFVPLPHPSWRTLAWERANPWFSEELLPNLRERIAVLFA